jgi:hypothetical protein
VAVTPTVRIIVDGEGRYVDIATTDTVLQPGQRIFVVTHPELNRLLSDDYVWLNNRDTLYERAGQALITNAEYLAIPSPTQAQALQQVRQLTRQVSATIRLLLAERDPHSLDMVEEAV